jgi:hypothetical protein
MVSWLAGQSWRGKGEEARLVMSWQSWVELEGKDKEAGLGWW